MRSRICFLLLFHLEMLAWTPHLLPALHPPAPKYHQSNQSTSKAETFGERGCTSALLASQWDGTPRYH